MDPIFKRPPVIDENDPRYFKIATGRVKTVEEKDEATGVTRYFIEGGASSSVRDRGGDTLTDSAQLSMLDQCKDLTMWLNHSYKVPEDILGTCGTSQLNKAVDPKFGECIDLDIRCEVYPGNPRAMESYNAVKAGIKLGYSIGGYFLDVELDEDPSANEQYWWPLIVNRIDLLEISLVGIPANPRAYTKGFDSGFVPYMLEGLRERVKSAGNSRNERYAFVKSLTGGSERNTVDPIIVGDLEIKHTDGKYAIFKKGVSGGNPLTTLAFKDGKIVKDADSDTTGALSTENQIRGVQALKSMKAAYGHGMCADAASNVKDAHEQVKAMMPDDYEYDDDNNPSVLAATSPSACSAIVGEISKLEPKSGDAIVIRGDVTPEQLAEFQKIWSEAMAETKVAFVALGADDKIDVTPEAAAQRSTDIKAAEAKIVTLTAEEKTLQEKIDKLAANPTGRQTAKPGGSSNGAAYQEKTRTVAEARKGLANAMAGISVETDPAMRPA